MTDLDGDLVRQQEQWYSSRPDYMQRMTERSRKYLFHIVEELERRNMPTELALLPFIESAFNPQAVSSARAAGMWQFMPATGQYFELKQNVFRDDRRDVLASTRAALDYLQKLYGMFGDWHLALAAYNWGEGNVSRAIARNQKRGLGTSYATLNMPNETRLYVPKLQAVKNIVANPETIQCRVAGHRKPSVLPERGRHARHRRGAGGPVGRRFRRRFQGPQPVDAPPGDPRGRHAADPAALGQRQCLPAQLRGLHRRASTRAGPRGARPRP